MAENAIQHVRLNFTFPTDRSTQPVLAQAVKNFDILVDIRRAEVEEGVGGYIVCEVAGTDQQIDDAVAFMKSLGVGVGFIGTDEVQAY